jgi:hypothetical protein
VTVMRFSVTPRKIAGRLVSEAILGPS